MELRFGEQRAAQRFLLHFVREASRISDCQYEGGACRQLHIGMVGILRRSVRKRLSDRGLKQVGSPHEAFPPVSTP